MSNVEQWDPLFPKYVPPARFLIIDPHRDEEMRFVVPLVHIATSEKNTLEEISSSGLGRKWCSFLFVWIDTAL